MTALYPFSHPRKGLPVSNPLQGRADRMTVTRGTDLCDSCHRQIDMSRDFHQMEWVHGFLRLTCEPCYFSDEQTLHGSSSEIDRNLSPESRAAIAGAKIDPSKRQTWQIAPRRSRADVVFYAVGLLIVVVIVAVTVVALVAK